MIDLVKARALCAAATPGPWRYVQILDGIEARALVDDKGYHFGRCDDLENGAFTAAARTGWPEALDAFEIALKIIEEYKVSNLQIEIRANRDIAALKAEVALIGEMHKKAVDERARLRTLMRSLLNKVNRVTAPYRHGNPVIPAVLAELAQRQIDVEAALAAPQTGGDADV